MTALISQTRIKPRRTSLHAVLNHQTFRRAVQLGFAAFILYVTVKHLAAGESSSNLTASAEAFCPFGGLETFYKTLVSGVPQTVINSGAAMVVSAVPEQKLLTEIIRVVN